MACPGIGAPGSLSQLGREDREYRYGTEQRLSRVSNNSPEPGRVGAGPTTLAGKVLKVCPAWEWAWDLMGCG
jgi:hypothetical protein